MGRRAEIRRGKKPVGPSPPWTDRPVRACLFWHPASGRHRRRLGGYPWRGRGSAIRLWCHPDAHPVASLRGNTGPVPPFALCFHSSAAILPHSLATPRTIATEPTLLVDYPETSCSLPFFRVAKPDIRHSAKITAVGDPPLCGQHNRHMQRGNGPDDESMAWHHGNFLDQER